MIRAKVVGGEQVAAKFRQLEKAVQKEMLETALVAGALVVQNEWKRRAPYRTGQYRRSIHIGGHTDLAPDFQGKDMGYHHRSSDPNRAHVAVGTNITDPPYPTFLEEGTSKMSARPSAGPAFEAKKDEAIKEIGEAFREIVGKLA